MGITYSIEGFSGKEEEEEQSPLVEGEDVPPAACCTNRPSEVKEPHTFLFLSSVYSLHSRAHGRLERYLTTGFDYNKKGPVVTLNSTRSSLTLTKHEWDSLYAHFEEIRDQLRKLQRCSLSFNVNKSNTCVRVKVQQIFGTWYVQISKCSTHIENGENRVSYSARDFEKLIIFSPTIHARLLSLTAISDQLKKQLYLKDVVPYSECTFCYAGQLHEEILAFIRLKDRWHTEHV
jgi:hypothetical protein